MKRSASLLAALLPLAACTQGGDLAGLPVPNAMPETRITAEPPNLVDSGVEVAFHWTGYDPDGRIRGFQWKLSANGTDGIGVQDTLTCDPATGQPLHPWRFTTRTDSLFLVTADLAGYPGDGDLPAADRRSYQTHTLFVRALDDEGGVDPTPAFVSFTATTVVPSVRVDWPNNLIGAAGGIAPPTVALRYIGSDPDFVTEAPTKVRYLWKPAIGPDGVLIPTYGYLHDADVAYLASFADTAWSDWFPYGDLPEQRRIVLPHQAEFLNDARGRQEAVYVFAIQAQDTAGAVSSDLTRQRNLLLVKVDRTLVPELVVLESEFGLMRATGAAQVFQWDIAQGQPVQFQWSANADAYGGQIVAYRHGWDLADPENQSDPNWATLPGNTSRHRYALPVSFDGDVHTLTVQAEDDSGQLTRTSIVLTVVPVPPPLARRDLLLVDAVPDRGSNGWLDEAGRALDKDGYRDAFWLDVLTGPGGLLDFDPALDVVDAEGDGHALAYRRVVNYRTLLWTTKPGRTCATEQLFKPQPRASRYVWLTPYQETLGNLFLAGDGALGSFVEDLAPDAASWMLPWIFTARDATWCDGNGRCWGTAFGRSVLPDGSETEVGRTRYPFRTLGVALLDRFVPDFVWGYRFEGARRQACVGLKALRLDAAFAAAHLFGGSPFPGTIPTEPTIDWEDRLTDPADPRSSRDTNLQGYFWKLDEFYEENVGSDRATGYEPELCDGRPCIEPMFRAYPRFDFVNDEQAALGNPDWPFDLVAPPGGEPRPRFSRTDPGPLNAVCGPLALRWRSDGEPHVRIRDVPVGIVSHRMERNKPTPRGDVVWGFDPYRFEHRHMKQAIRWVLGEHFGLPMRPGP